VKSVEKEMLPFITRKILPGNIDQCLRLWCNMLRYPFAANIGIFVVVTETSIMMINGMLAKRVSGPDNIKITQVISKQPRNLVEIQVQENLSLQLIRHPSLL
jgi:hypothetical protein